ncbi:hypothetical protein G6F57_013460 [Rhizopus arrhizus]|nr:hypothetical protein G6F57_013460 [Rhizopus arrhizus]
MGHQPLLAIVVAEQLGAGHPEHAPALPPDPCGRFAVGSNQHRHHAVAGRILVGQPMIGGALVMGAIDQPTLLQLQVALEVQQGIGGRHQPAGEEMPAHPVVAAVGLERIHQRAVRENVHEKRAVRLQPLRDAREQALVVAHVFEHFHRDAAVELRVWQFQLVDVAGEHLDVVQPSRRALRQDVLALAVRVGHGGDPGERIALGHPQGQRAPAATQLQDVLAIGQPGTFAVQGQHRVFGLVQRLVAGRAAGTS